MGQYGIDCALEAELILELNVDITEPLVIGQTNQGYTKVIPISGGSFCGAQLKGHIVPGGADWNTAMGKTPDDPSGIRQIFAKYVICTDEGDYINVENEGWKSLNPANATRICTVPKLQTSCAKYDWMNYGVYVGTLTPKEGGGGVKLGFYRMK